jgi:protoheme IX farnesyltransferase
MITPYLQLCKINIAFFAALSAATGFILAASDLNAAILAPVLGVFFLACGAGALNQYQERYTDALMLRTRSRPIPSGKIEALHARYISSLLLLTGLSILAITGHLIVLGLGLFAVIWYNLVYIHLKRKTAFAAVPGALTGCIPPAVGWVAGGGDPADYRLLALCFFYFMWQVPHFWLLLLSYDGDFKNTELPSLNRIFNWDQMVKVTSIWMSAAAVSLLLIPLYGVSTSNIINLLLCSAAVWLAWNGVKFYRQKDEKPSYLPAFKSINIYMLLVMLILNIGSLF